MIPLHDNNEFINKLYELRKKLKIDFEYTIIFLDKSIIDDEILKSKCYNGGSHLLNLGNFSRLLVGEYFNYDKLLYLDADSIIKYDLFDKINNIKMTNPIYLQKGDRPKLTLYLKSILQSNINWKKIINKDINLENFAYFGAPMLINCKKCNNMFSSIKKVIKEHNKEKNGIYKLFTMSLVNIIFYNEIGNLNLYIKCLPDCGSLRKNWSENELKNSDILDWSGNLKPWFSNGLYKNEWEKYNLLYSNENKIKNKNEKNTVENFSV